MALRDDLQKIVDEFKSAQVPDEILPPKGYVSFSYPPAYGYIRLAERVVTGKHTTNIYKLGIQVGSLVPREIHKAIEAKVKALIPPPAICGSSHGSAWSIYGLIDNSTRLY